MPTPSMPRRQRKYLFFPKGKFTLMFVVKVYNESGYPAAHFWSFEPLLGTYLEWISDDPGLSASALTMGPNANASDATPMA